MTAPKLVDVPGVGPATADRLEAAGVATVGQLASADLDIIASFPGFHRQRAGVIVAAAQQLLEASASAKPAKAPKKTDKKAGKKKDSKKKGKKAKKKAKKKAGKKKNSKKKGKKAKKKQAKKKAKK